MDGEGEVGSVQLIPPEKLNNSGTTWTTWIIQKTLFQ